MKDLNKYWYIPWGSVASSCIVTNAKQEYFSIYNLYKIQEWNSELQVYLPLYSVPLHTTCPSPCLFFIFHSPSELFSRSAGIWMGGRKMFPLHKSWVHWSKLNEPSLPQRYGTKGLKIAMWSGFLARSFWNARQTNAMSNVRADVASQVIGKTFSALFPSVFVVTRVVFTVAPSCLQAHVNSSLFYYPNISLTHCMIENFLEGQIPA